MMDSLQSERGYALIIVMWGLVIITIIFVNLVDEVQLNSLLVRHNLDEKKVRQVALSGVNIGISLLREDKTVYDTEQDQWTNLLEGELDNLIYKIEIDDIGSRLNINYTEDSILAQFSWFNEDLKNKIEEDELIYELFLIKDTLKEDYSVVSQKLTTYGRFNINTDRLDGLRDLLKLNGVPEYQIEIILKDLSDLREDEQVIESLEELPLDLPSMGVINFDNLEPYLTTEGRYNINLVSGEILKALANSLKINQDSWRSILKYREQREIKDLRELEFIPEEEFIKLKPYLTTSSNYFLIKVEVFNLSGNKAGKVKTVVRRTGEDNNQIEFLKWSEEE